MKAPTATQQKPPHRSDREDEALDIVDLLLELNASHSSYGLGMPTVSGDTLALPAACWVHAYA